MTTTPTTTTMPSSLRRKRRRCREERSFSQWSVSIAVALLSLAAEVVSASTWALPRGFESLEAEDKQVSLALTLARTSENSGGGGESGDGSGEKSSSSNNNNNRIQRRRRDESVGGGGGSGASAVASERVVNGADAPFGEYPYFARLRTLEDGSFFHVCGGALIASQHVITAAHCIVDREKVRSAPWDTPLRDLLRQDLWGFSVGYVCQSIDNCEEPQYKMEVDEWFPHPEFDTSREWLRDVAIGRLRRPVRDPRILERLPQMDVGSIIQSRTISSAPQFQLMGAGRVDDAGSNREVLQEITVDYVPTDRCEARWGMQEGSLEDVVFCTSVPTGGGSCKGDSGSPIVHTSSSNVDVLVGLHSASWPFSCEAKGAPDIETRLSVPFIRFWIQSIVCPFEGRGDKPVTNICSSGRGGSGEFPSPPSLDDEDALAMQTTSPTNNPTLRPSANPTINPTLRPSANPTINPTLRPTAHPTINPMVSLTAHPTISPSKRPATTTTVPTTHPLTTVPTFAASSRPTNNGVLLDGDVNTMPLSVRPTWSPNTSPSLQPIMPPSAFPSFRPTSAPSTLSPTASPWNDSDCTQDAGATFIQKLKKNKRKECTYLSTPKRRDKFCHKDEFLANENCKVSCQLCTP